MSSALPRTPRVSRAMWEPEMRGQRIEEEREKGQILVLFALVLVVILAFAAIAVDLGVLRNNRQILRNTTDAAALAGGTLMPVDGSAPGAADAVATLINSTIQTNYPDLPQSTTAIDSRCVVGVDPGIADCAYTISYRCLIGADSTGPLISRAMSRRLVIRVPHLVPATSLRSSREPAQPARPAALRRRATSATSLLSKVAPPPSMPSLRSSGSRPAAQVPSPRPPAAGRAGRCR